MTLVVNRRRRGPATHVLIVGVGGYRHLAGHPVGPRMSDPYAFGGLGQLTSPPVSALEMVKVFAESDSDSWRAPLGSVDALISPHPANPTPGGPGTTYSQPTAANIQRAYDKWWDRCDQDSDNVAILYLCGHGIEGDEQYFLASDFGANPRRPWENAIAIDSTIKGLWHNRAETQCVLVDACREIVPASRTTAKISGRPLDQFSEDRTISYKYPLVLKAVAATERAFAQEGATAYFTQALAHALRGGAAVEDDDTGAWAVTTAGIASKIHEILTTVAPDRTHSAEPVQGKSSSLRLLRTPPTVTVRVDCDPNDANKLAAFSCDSNDDATVHFERTAGEPDAWELELPAGYYTLAARFRTSTYKDARRNLLAAPPQRRPKLRVWK
jgi:hypothetical protein